MHGEKAITVLVFIFPRREVSPTAIDKKALHYKHLPLLAKHCEWLATLRHTKKQKRDDINISLHIKTADGQC